MTFSGMVSLDVSNEEQTEMKTNWFAGIVAGISLLGATCAARAESISIIDNPTLLGVEQHDPSYPSPQNTYQAYDASNNLAHNGITPIVSSTIPGLSSIHNAANLTDGNYGNGRSWIGNTSFDWFILDLGSTYTIDSVIFGRDRLGYYDDRDPTTFTILTSLDGNAFNAAAYSSHLSFSGNIYGNDSILTSFAAVDARYVKVSFTGNEVAIDEVEVHAAAPVPEPATLLLMSAGLVGLAGVRRKNLN